MPSLWDDGRFRCRNNSKSCGLFFHFLGLVFLKYLLSCGHLQEQAATKVHQLLCFQHGCIRPLQPFDRHDYEDRWDYFRLGILESRQSVAAGKHSMQPYLISLVVSIGIRSLLLISIDRLIAVVFPLKAKLISSKVRLISILSTWFVAIAVHAPYFYSFKLIPYENETNCIMNWEPAFDHKKTHEGFISASFITFTLIPFLALVIVYSIITWTIRKKNKKSSAIVLSPKPSRSAAEENCQIGNGHYDFLRFLHDSHAYVFIF